MGEIVKPSWMPKKPEPFIAGVPSACTAPFAAVTGIGEDIRVPFRSGLLLLEPLEDGGDGGDRNPPATPLPTSTEHKPPPPRRLLPLSLLGSLDTDKRRHK